MFAVQCPPDGQWQLFSLATPSTDGGVGSLVPEGQAMGRLEWPSRASEAPLDLSWLGWTLAAAGAAACLLLLSKHSRRVRSFFAREVSQEPPAGSE
jgi:hypothetical protein